MSAAIGIRDARECEIAVLCRMMREDYAPYDVQGTIYQSARFDRYLADRFGTHDLFLAASDQANGDVPIGFAHVLPGENSFHLNHLILGHSARGQGYGSRLLQAVIAHAEEKEQSVTLDVNSRNHAAIRFYANAGFSVEQETPVVMIPRRSGSFPSDLVKHSGDYERYGFCYAILRLLKHETRIGIVGQRIVRVFAKSLPVDLDWKEFINRVRWADVFIYGKVPPLPDISVQETWSVLRMVR